jgi:twinkle protein
MSRYEDHGIETPPPGRGEYRTRCPECSPHRKGNHAKEKDLSINRDRQTWYCHHCSWKGGLGLDPNGYGTVEKQYQRPKPTVRAESQQEKIESYLTKRGISVDIQKQEDVHAVTAKCRACDKFLTAIAFPYYRNDAHINTTYIHRIGGDKHVWQETGAERILWGLDSITPEMTEVIICEGQIDRLSFLQCGYANVLSVPDGAPQAGTSNTDSKFTYLESAKSVLDGKIIVLAGDNDPSGQAMNDEIARRLGRERCKRIQWPEYINDANEALMQVGPALIAECVETASFYPVEGAVRVNDVWDTVLDLYEYGYDPGLTLGYDRLDQFYRVRPGMMTVITGVPSHGKSLWIDHVISRMMGRHGWKIGIFSPENQPLRRHIANLTEILVQKPFNLTFDNRMSIIDLEDRREFLNDHALFILPPSPTIENILSIAELYVRQEGLNGIVIDPWNEIEGVRPSHISLTEYINECLGKIKQFIRKYDVHVWVMAHPTKWTAETPDQAPGLASISGSAHFYNKADVGITIWRNPKDTSIPAQAQIEKVRFSEIGKVGTVWFKVDPKTRQIMEVENA